MAENDAKANDIQPDENPNQITLVASPPVLWLCGSLLAVLIAGGGWWLQTVYAEGQETQRSATHNTRRLDAVDERLKSIESSQKRLEQDSHQGFDKLERKIDTLIERELKEHAGLRDPP